jgi:hypothetical protein
MSTYLEQMSSKYSQAPVLTTHESQAENAMVTASNNVEDGTMTPAQGLTYIDTRANSNT